ncbi:MAG TPA: BON domain-containing protein [Solimonas sp.]
MRRWRAGLLMTALLLPLASPAANLEQIGRETQIYAAFATSDALRPLGLTVSAEGEHVVLSGVVRNEAQKRLAEQVARDSGAGVAVDNRIEVDAQQATALQRAPELPARKLRDRLHDALLTARIKLRLLRHDVGGALDLNVDTVSGHARLQGIADGAEDRAQLIRIAAATPGVREVEERIALRAPEGATPDLEAPRASLVDAWITARLKSSLLLSREVDGHAIAVATSRGAVRLSGHVSTPAERSAAVEIARGISGVRDVDASSLSTG